MATDTERQLLFGAIVLQLDLIGRHDLISALKDWANDRSQSLAEVLTHRHLLTAKARSILTTLVDARLEQHGGDPSLAISGLTDLVTALEVATRSDDSAIQAGATVLLGAAQAAGATPTEPYHPHGAGEAAPSGVTADDGDRVVLRARLRLGPRHRRGGLGEVIKAEDDALGRTLALKRVRDDLADHPLYCAKFLLEAEITSKLQHPGVVPIHGLGAFENGKPFYVMPFVEGPLDEGDTLADAIRRAHHPEARFSPADQDYRRRRLLRRFVAACETIAYAHDKQVIHRDIKPANILLGRYGETLVIDWGLAKWTARPGADGGPSPTAGSPLTFSTDADAHTAPGQIVGTLAYMAPEQARGELDHLGPAADIYSLGATLYCLLTGQAPATGVSKEEFLRRLAAGEIPAPRSVRSEVPRPLEAICMKAMAPRPTDRYATALDLAKDVENWLDDRAVTVYPEPWRDRLARWARHHRGVVGSSAVGAAATLLALTVGLGFTVREQRRTETEFQAAHALASNLVETAEKRLSRVPDTEQARRSMVEQAVVQFDRWAQQRPNEAKVLYDSAMTHFYLANLLRFFNEDQASDPHFAEALGLLERTGELGPYDPRLEDRMAEVWRDRGQLALRLGKSADARPMIERALRIVEELLVAQPGSLEFRRTKASILLNMIELAQSQGRDIEAEAHARAAVGLYDSLVADKADANEKPMNYSTSTGQRLVPLLHVMAINEHARVLFDLGRYDAAAPLHDRAVERAQALLAAAPTRDHRFQLARSHALRGRTLAQVEARLADAETSLLRAFEAFKELAEANGGSLAYHEMLAVTRHGIGIVRWKQDRPDEARRELAAAGDMLTNWARKVPQIPRVRWRLGLVLFDRAELERSQGRDQEAAKHQAAATAALDSAAADAPDNARYQRDRERLRSRR